MSNNDGIQMTFRLSQDLHNQCQKLAEDNGQTFAEWIRRAMKEKLQRDSAAQSSNDILTKSDVEKIVKDAIRSELLSSISVVVPESKKVKQSM